ncbi:CDC45-related protein, partial [Gryllus bimaculatus]
MCILATIDSKWQLNLPPEILMVARLLAILITMHISNLKNEFYQPLIGNKILLLVHYDVDAVCACKILQYLFRSDHISYTLVPVRGVEELKYAFLSFCKEVKYVLFVNCGGTIDLIDTLEPENSIVFFVLDAHRPTDVCNVYSPDQVKLLVPRSDDEKIPHPSEIFRDESDEDDDDDESGDEGDRQDRRRQKAEEAMRKRREKRQWEENRNHVLFSYTQYSYYGRSSAVVMYELAWRMSKDTNDLLWLAIVGATEQMLLAKVDYQRLQLALYRHWTVEASLRYSRYSATKLRLWTLRGESKVQELLAEIGLPLVQSRQKFTSMNMILRKEFPESMEKLGEKYNMDRIMTATFFLQYGYRGRFCAFDFVYGVLALLESRGTLDVQLYSSPLCLGLLAQFALEAYVGSSRSKKAASQPLIASAPLDPEKGTCLLLGIPPVADESSNNFFGKAFEQAGERISARMNMDYFDTSSLLKRGEGGGRAQRLAACPKARKRLARVCLPPTDLVNKKAEGGGRATVLAQ